jgi:hypothetical protein
MVGSYVGSNFQQDRKAVVSGTVRLDLIQIFPRFKYLKPQTESSATVVTDKSKIVFRPKRIIHDKTKRNYGGI